MKLKNVVFLTVAGLATVAALPSLAQTADTIPPVAPFLQQGSTINNAAIANDYAPGDAHELSPDSGQTATGGPSGGFGRGGAAGGN